MVAGVVAVIAAVLVSLLPHPHAHRHSRHTPDRAKAVAVNRRVFGWRWRTATCVTWNESNDELDPRHNNRSRGPFQVDPVAHPWVRSWWLTHSWLYSARVAFRISHGGRDWSAWSTHGLCGV